MRRLCSYFVNFKLKKFLFRFVLPWLILAVYVIVLLSSSIDPTLVEESQRRQNYRKKYSKSLEKNSVHLEENKIYDSNKNKLNEHNFVLELKIDDIFISVKTTKRFHHTRLALILKTWFALAFEQIYIFTDSFDDSYNRSTNGHLINTLCKSHHSNKDLNCKLGFEYDTFMKRNEKWWCHFDDDNYVHVNRLVSVLNQYDYKSDVYLGRPSMSQPMWIIAEGKPVHFMFATGGAGFCLTRSVAESMSPWSSDGKFVMTSADVHLPDDCTTGYIITNLLKINLTTSKYFHSHLETLDYIDEHTLDSQVSLSYSLGDSPNVVNINPDIAAFSSDIDPTRILSAHCLLYPATKYCPFKSKNNIA